MGMRWLLWRDVLKPIFKKEVLAAINVIVDELTSMDDQCELMHTVIYMCIHEQIVVVILFRFIIIVEECIGMNGQSGLMRDPPTHV